MALRIASWVCMITTISNTKPKSPQRGYLLYMDTTHFNTSTLVYFLNYKLPSPIFSIFFPPSMIIWRCLNLPIVSFLPKIQDFPKSSVWGEEGKSLFKVPGEKGFWWGIWTFRFWPGGKVWFLTIYNVCSHIRYSNFKIFSNQGGIRLKFQLTYVLES